MTDEPQGRRVLIVSSEAPPTVSGLAASVGRLSSGLAELGHDVEVFSAGDAPQVKRGEIRLSAMAFAPALMAKLRSVDVVSLHGPTPTVSDVVVMALQTMRASTRPRLIYTHHFTVELEQRLLQPLCSIYERGAMKLAQRADRVVVTSEGYRSLIDRKNGPAVSVIPWGVDHERFVHPERQPYAGDRPLRVLYLGQLREYKGAGVAIDAVAGLDGVELTVAGKGPMLEELQRRTTAPAYDNVRMLGYVPEDEVTGLYADHDVVLLPSVNRLEAFGLVLLEGMSAGCVPVASDLPGVREVAGPTGCLAAPGDPDDLRWILMRLAERPDVVERMQAESIERAREFSWDACLEGYDRLIGDVARRGRLARAEVASIA